MTTTSAVTGSASACLTTLAIRWASFSAGMTTVAMRVRAGTGAGRLAAVGPGRCAPRRGSDQPAHQARRRVNSWKRGRFMGG